MKYAPARLPDDADQQILDLIPRRWVANDATRRGIRDEFMSWLMRLPCVPIEGEWITDAIAKVLSACYVKESGLLEDDQAAYAEKLRPHAEAVLALLQGVAPEHVWNALATRPAADGAATIDDTELVNRLLYAVRGAILEAGSQARMSLRGSLFAASYIHLVEAKAGLEAALRTLADLYEGKRAAMFERRHVMLLREIADLVAARPIPKPSRHRRPIERPPANGDVREKDGRQQVWLDGAWFWVGDIDTDQMIQARP